MEELKMKHKIASFYVTSEEFELLKKCADLTRRPINNFVKHAVFEYIEKFNALEKPYIVGKNTMTIKKENNNA